VETAGGAQLEAPHPLERLTRVAGSGPERRHWAGQCQRRRTIGLELFIVEELTRHLARTAYNGNDEPVFCDPQTGRSLDPMRYSRLHKPALRRAAVDKPLRPFHGIRHSALTNDAASGMDAMALMTPAGHSSFRTTQGHIHLAGELFSGDVVRSGTGVEPAQRRATTPYWF